MATAFINYRRTDRPHAAQALYSQLRARFGPTNIFFDIGSILPGMKWAETLQSSLDQASVLLVVIGPQWLSAANEYFQRRIDDESDWVRNEIEYAIKTNKPIIPVLVAGANELPPPAALPVSLHGLLNHQAFCIRDEKWDTDFNDLLKELVETHRLIENQSPVLLPRPELTCEPLTAPQLREALEKLSGWQSIESILPSNYPKPRQELRKNYQFKSFKSAMRFMGAGVEIISESKHHPRWENQWRTVVVYLTTWDIGNKITDLDIQLATKLDELYEKLRDT